jgi:uncharacterized protein
MQYVAPLWLPGGNLQTIWPALYARRAQTPLPAFRRERWDTPDGDFIDVDFLGDAAAAAPRPLLVLFHGLEGSSKSHYAEAFAAFAMERGWDYAVPHFRGCSGELNLAPRAYHSGDYEEIGWILERLHAQHGGPMLAAGVSLGGNALMRWAEEAGHEASRLVSAVASISAPLDLAAGGIPALAVNATNDPFVPAASLPRQEEVGKYVTLWQPAHGGHVGFPLGAPPGHVRGMPERVGGWLAQHLSL